MKKTEIPINTTESNVKFNRRSFIKSVGALGISCMAVAHMPCSATEITPDAEGNNIQKDEFNGYFPWLGP